MTLTPGMDQTPGQTCTFSENMTDGLVLTEYGNYTLSNGVTISETSGVAMRITQTSATGTSNVQIDGSLIGSNGALRSTGDAHVTVGQDGLLQSTGSSYALEIAGDTESSLTLEGNINSFGDGLEIIADTVSLNLTDTSDITAGDDAFRIEATSVTAQIDGTITANGNAIIIGAGSVTVGAAAVIDLGEGAFQMGGAGDGVVVLDGLITAEDMLILYDGINDVTISGTIVLTEIGADGIIIGDPNNPNSSSIVNFTGSITSVNDGLQILANATVFASGTINAINDTAISMSSGGSLDFTGAIESSMFGIIGNANLNISGTISSSFYAVFNAFDTYLASNSLINVDGTNGFEAGVVQGYGGTNTSSITALGQITSSGDGIYIFGADTEAFVGGSITADRTGIIIQQSDLSNGTTNLTFNGTMSTGAAGIVINANTVANISGTIVSGGTALDIGTGNVDVTVTGLVIGAEYAVDARGFGLDLTLVNLGTLDGDIILSDDDDYFDNSLGNIGTGHTIDIGEGDDQFIGGSSDEYVIMSGGSNIVSGGDGTDTLDYSQAAANINANLNTGNITQTQPYISSFFSEFDMPLTDVIDALMAGTLYINLSTTDFPTGALRLQLDMPTSDITGEFGDRTITFDDILLIPINGAPDQSVRAYITFSEFFGDWSIDIELSVDDLPLTSITSLEFREGLMGETGPVLLDILNDPNTDVDTFTLADQVSTFENVIGTDFDDVIIGNDEDNIFSGLGGDDILNGGAGRDTLDGGLGADQMTGGTGNDTYFVDNAGDVIIEEAGEGYENVNVTLNAFFLTIGDNLERVNFQGTGNFVSRGNELNNRFTGAAGNDKFLLDSGGADIFSGGQGRDAFDARSSTIGIQLHLEDQSLNADDVAGDIFASMESFFGSNTAGDYMQTGAARARFSGFGGDDTLIGGASVDFLQGGADNDSLFGNAARDTLQGGTGDDIMTGGADRDQFLFVKSNFGEDTITDYEDGLDYLKIFSAVADDISDFIITGNGTDTVTLTLDDGTGNNVLTLESGDGSIIDITAADFQFYG